jgi:hypothetical protein
MSEKNEREDKQREDKHTQSCNKHFEKKRSVTNKINSNSYNSFTLYVRIYIDDASKP